MTTQEITKTPIITETNFSGLKLYHRGKVRDMYDLGNSLLIVVTDRISAYDVVMDDGIEGKGIVLNRVSNHWSNLLVDIVPNHIITDDVDLYPKACRPYADILRGRSVLVRKCEPFMVECIVRGYLSGSGWKSYQEKGTVCGIKLPPGLRESDKLPEPLFTPSTKAPAGDHDENISFTEMVRIVGKKNANDLRRICHELYERAAALALAKGIIIADTKFELAIINGMIVLIDEVLTPDSSRFWPREFYCPGGPQKSYDKQYLRDYLSGLAWNKTAPAPPVPEEVNRITSEKYHEVEEIILSIK